MCIRDRAEQIFTIDKSRALKYLGHLTPEEMRRVDDAVRISLALTPMGSIQQIAPIPVSYTHLVHVSMLRSGLGTSAILKACASTKCRRQVPQRVRMDLTISGVSSSSS